MHKRLLLFLIISSMICSMIPVYAWNSPSLEPEEFAKELLQTLQIMDTDSKSGFDPAKTLNRAELANILVKLANAESQRGFKSYFTDVLADTQHADAICALTSMGIVEKGERFEPLQTATYAQAVKMIVYMLGYEPEVIRRGGNLETCMSIASNIGLTSGIKVKDTTALNYGMLLTLCYNALDCEVMYRDIDGDYIKKQDKTLLTETFKIYKTKGIVTENYHTSLNATSHTFAKSQVKIENVEYDDPTGKVCDYIGLEVQGYYRDDNNLANQLVACMPTSKNQILKIRATDLDYKSEEYDYTHIFYFNENGKSIRASIDKEADVIYNGKAFLSFTIDTLKPKTGEIRLVDNNTDGKADVVFVNEFEDIVVNAIGDESIYNKYGKSLNLKLVKELEIESMYGEQMNLKQLKEWDVLSVFKSMDGELVRIVCMDDPVVGEVEAKYIENDFTYVTIDGDTFSIAESYLQALKNNVTNAKPIEIGMSGTFYLDRDERIAAVSLEADAAWRYGYLLKMYLDDVEEHMRFKILTDVKGAKMYEGADKIKLDGTNYKNLVDITKLPDECNLSKPQLIKFKMDGSGRINGIDTAFQGKKENKENLQQNADKEKQYWSIRTGRFGNDENIGIQLDLGSTLIFQVPTKDIDDEEKYSVRTVGFKNNESITMDAYDADFSGLAKAVVVYQDSKDSSVDYGRLILVDSITESLNSDDEVVKVVHGFSTSGEEISCQAENFEELEGIKKGDIITYNLNYKNNLINLICRFHAKDATYTSSSLVFNSPGDYSPAYTSNAQDYMTRNIIMEKQGKHIKALVPGIELSSLSSTQLTYKNTQIYSLQDAVIYLCDGTKGKIQKISESDLEEYVYTVNPSARVILYSTYTQLRTVYVYR